MIYIKAVFFRFEMGMAWQSRRQEDCHAAFNWKQLFLATSRL
jgi:hypothetical protein